MIRIENLTKSYKTRAGRHYLFRDVNLEIPSGRNVGILGANGAGKSTFLRILGGIDFPDSGRIHCPYRLSWPLGIAGGFVGHLTGRENCALVCRAYGLMGDQVGERLESIKELSGIGNYFEEPIRYYSSGMNGRLNFSLSMAFDFEYFLIDEVTSVGDVRFREQAQAELEKKRERSRVIMVSHSMGTIRDFCEVGIVLRDGEMRYFEDLDEALKAYFPKPKKLQKASATPFRTDLDQFFEKAFSKTEPETQRLVMDFKMAWRELLEALEVASEIEDEAAFFHQLGNLTFQIGAWHQALGFYRKAIYLDEQRLALYPQFVNCLSQCGLKQEALETIDRILSWDPNQIAMLGQKAMISYQIGALETALECAQEATRLEPENGARWHLLANTQFATGDAAAALQTQIQTLELDESNPNHWELLSRILSQLGHWQRAALARFRHEELRNQAKPPPSQTQRIQGWLQQIERLMPRVR